MGGSLYSGSVFKARLATASTSKAGFFTRDHDVRTRKVATVVDPSLDPALPNKAGQRIRECLDSAAHPLSTAICCLFDVTGSQRQVPPVFVKKLGSLMSLLVKKGYVTDPSILFGAVGDAYSDKVPLQIGQFEAGNEIDSTLASIYLEGNGGSQQTESYELVFYFLARHTKLDCLDKRGKKGYLFISGDELPKASVNKEQVKRLIGDDLEADIPLAQIIEEVKAKFEVIWLFPNMTSYWDNPEINAALKQMWGQNLVKLEDPETVAEVIAAAIGVAEGYDVKSIEDDLITHGSTKDAARGATSALSTYVKKGGALAKVASVTGKLDKHRGKDSVQRL